MTKTVLLNHQYHQKRCHPAFTDISESVRCGGQLFFSPYGLLLTICLIFSQFKSHPINNLSVQITKASAIEPARLKTSKGALSAMALTV